MRLASTILLSAVICVLESPSVHGQSAETIPPGVAAPPPVSGTIVPPRPITTSTNLLLNGDFEIYRNVPPFPCAFNLDNATFTSTLMNVTGFGEAAEIDVMNDPVHGCYYLGPPESGNVKIAIASQKAGGPADAFSMDLSAPLVGGATYDLTFYAWAGDSATTNSPAIGAVEVGVSTNPATFGSTVLSLTPQHGHWTQLSGSFVSPIDATQLTFREATNGRSWNHLDNMVLTADQPVPAVPSSWGKMKAHYR